MEEGVGEFVRRQVKVTRQGVCDDIFAAPHMLGEQAGADTDDDAAQATGDMAVDTVSFLVERGLEQPADGACAKTRSANRENGKLCSSTVP